MQIHLTNEQIDRLIEALEKSYMSQKDRYLIDYLKTVRRLHVQTQQVDLDECPF
jgi:hypothetical protein